MNLKQAALLGFMVASASPDALAQNNNFVVTIINDDSFSVTMQGGQPQAVSTYDLAANTAITRKPDGSTMRGLFSDLPPLEKTAMLTLGCREAHRLNRAAFVNKHCRLLPQGGRPRPPFKSL
ncbi:MAG: hypothetical protein KGQ41_02990 [Alphaproteobacteria bacterium]|nr:hypothetical protein [Alphaproteobacteria bacterium]